MSERFYLSESPSGKEITFSDPSQLHHLKDVLRLGPGDEIVLFDPKGNEYKSAIEKVTKTSAQLKVLEVTPHPPSKISLAVGCAIPKGGRMDEIIDNLTQLDVTTIIPLATDRGNVNLELSRAKERLERWQRIALSAARQSQRNTLPVIEQVTSFSKILGKSKGYELKIIPTLAVTGKHISKVLPAPPAGHAIILIGPEGDFTQEEVNEAVKAGYVPVSLGGTVLRVGLAAVVVVSYVKLVMGL